MVDGHNKARMTEVCELKASIANGQLKPPGSKMWKADDFNPYSVASATTRIKITRDNIRLLKTVFIDGNKY